jgi:hypothetical protein
MGGNYRRAGRAARKAFFFEKKQQKSFTNLAAAVPG